MSELARWLGERLAAAPADLRERMATALDAAGGGVEATVGDARGVARRLRETGDRLMELAARGGPGTPEVALTLLAADGFATLACELLAEKDPVALGDAE